MKHLLIYILLLLPFAMQAQKNDVDRYIEQQQENNAFPRSKKYKGPEGWSQMYPNQLEEQLNTHEEQQSNTTFPLNSIVDPEELNGSRIEKYGEQYGEGAVKQPNPEIVPPNPIELPEIKLPEINLPEVNIPDFDLPSMGILGKWSFWKIVFIIIIIAIVILGVYLIIRNYRPSDTKIKMDVDDEWNPTVVTKSELELKLEKAELGNNYRECVRIHFMFILKELISNEYIQWKAEKTNFDYLIEVRKNKGYDSFEECVRIYDLVWYGDYEISLSEYNRLKPALESYYQSLLQKP